MAWGHARDRSGAVHLAGSPLPSGEPATIPAMAIRRTRKTKDTAVVAAPDSGAVDPVATAPEPARRPEPPTLDEPPTLAEPPAVAARRPAITDHDQEW